MRVKWNFILGDILNFIGVKWHFDEREILTIHYERELSTIRVS